MATHQSQVGILTRMKLVLVRTEYQWPGLGQSKSKFHQPQTFSIISQALLAFFWGWYLRLEHPSSLPSPHNYSIWNHSKMATPVTVWHMIRKQMWSEKNNNDHQTGLKCIKITGILHHFTNSAGILFLVTYTASLFTTIPLRHYDHLLKEHKHGYRNSITLTRPSEFVI